MILMHALGLFLSTAILSGPSAVQDDPSAALRRLAATAQLAAQEYAIGVVSGSVVSQAEVDEAELFLAEALRAADGLPDGVRSRTRTALESILSMVRSTADPADVALAVGELTSGLSQELGIALDILPRLPPSHARGAELYQTECAVSNGMRVVPRGPGCGGWSRRGGVRPAASRSERLSPVIEPVAPRFLSPCNHWCGRYRHAALRGPSQRGGSLGRGTVLQPPQVAGG